MSAFPPVKYSTHGLQTCLHGRMSLSTTADPHFDAQIAGTRLVLWTRKQNVAQFQTNLTFSHFFHFQQTSSETTFS